MTNCELCKKKFSVWNASSYNDKYYCPDCWKNKQEQITGKKKEVDKKKEPVEITIREYKRTCNECGKVWHSLVEREKQVAIGSFWNAIAGVGTAIGGNYGATGQFSRNSDAQQQELVNLKRCPNCGSSNYKEEITSFKRMMQG